MKLYTKTGDGGETGLFGGGRVAKHHLRIEAYGTLDELNACLGVLSDQPVNAERPARIAVLIEIQNTLFTIGSLLATPVRKPGLALPELSERALHQLEAAIDDMDANLPEMRYFILPGGHVSVSFAHMARCVCRRAERCIARLRAADELVDAPILPYMNRLSDYLFMLARQMGQDLGIAERPWVPEKHAARTKNVSHSS